MDDRFLRESGLEVFTGNELLIKGALEAGVHLITGYPGSPVADVFEVASALRELLKEHGIVAQMANNEALAAARLNGSQMADLRAMAVMKSVGAHVAADGLALGNLAKRAGHGGAIVVVGDDPWSDSTQVPADTRYLSAHLQIPVLEPSTFQEIKDWVGAGFDLSYRSGLFVCVIITTNQADGGGSVEVHPNRYPAINTRSRIALETDKIPTEETVLLPPRTGNQEATLPHRVQEFKKAVRALAVDKILYGESRAPFGIVTSGLSYLYLEQALRDLGLSGRVPILKLGVTYPIDEAIVLEFARKAGRLVVIEEKRDFVESQVTLILKNAFQGGLLSILPEVWGKQFPAGLNGIPSTRGLGPSILIERLVPLVKHYGLPADAARLEREVELIRRVSQIQLKIPARTPTFCPGCPHRDSSSVLLSVKKDFKDPAYMSRVHHRSPVDLVSHGDTGCYTMLMFEPNSELMHNYSGMGLGGGTGAGIDPFITNKQIVFMGDSTFFHGGISAISDSLKHHQDITYIILDNKTTAMTGHQPTPSTETDILGNPTFAQDIEECLRGMTKGGRMKIVRTSPEDHPAYRQLLERTILSDGVKVIIADKECGITFHRRKRQELNQEIKRRGFLARERHININEEACEYCFECTKSTGCPGITTTETAFGPKMAIDGSTCVTDGACTQVKACPAFEEVTVIRRQAPPAVEAREITPPAEVSAALAPEGFRCYVTGVGGMGIGLVTAILVRAGFKQGYAVHFSDKKGLAIRNGGVYSHLTFARPGEQVSPIIPYGKADLLLGIDLLESVRGLDARTHFRIADPARTNAIVNTARTHTISTLIGKEAFDVDALVGHLKKMTRPAGYAGANFSAISEEHFGNKLYANLILLGLAYQKGFIPLSLSNLTWAIEKTVRRDDREKNLHAFTLGRRMAQEPGRFGVQPKQQSLEELISEKRGFLPRALARGYESLVRPALESMRLSEELAKDFALRVYDLIRYEDLRYAARYVEKVAAVRRAEGMTRSDAARAVIWNLHKVMAIKDEVFVARQLTSPEKYARDRARYQVDPSRGDKIVYRHFNRPEFVVGPWRIEFDWKSRDWQLKIMRHLKFLRRLMPRWHAREKTFRDWYLALVDRFVAEGASGSAQGERGRAEAYVEAFNLPEAVTGYRAVRYPKMDEARRKADVILTLSRDFKCHPEERPSFRLVRDEGSSHILDSSPRPKGGAQNDIP